MAPLDVMHLGRTGAICAYFVERPEPLLVDPGPTTSLPSLEAALEEVGVRLSDLRHLLLTHVHLDHAGGAGHLVHRNPTLAVHVHADGAPHLADPERLVASTRRTFGDDHDRFWGRVLPIPKDRLRAWRPGEVDPLPGVRGLPTPGHIAHHVAWESDELGVLFCGDALGVVLAPDAPSHPTTPAPGVDLAAWRETLSTTLASVDADLCAPTHFGLHPDLAGRRRRLRVALDDLAGWVHRAMDDREGEEEAIEAFTRETLEAHRARLPNERVDAYFSVFPPSMDWAGMRFHLARTPDARP